MYALFTTVLFKDFSLQVFLVFFKQTISKQTSLEFSVNKLVQALHKFKLKQTNKNLCES